MTALTEKQKHHLRGLGHKLKPVVMLGAAGFSEAVRTELEAALTYHELLKIRVSAPDREAREEMLGQIRAATGAQLIQRIGHVALLYRRNPEKSRIVLP